MIGRLACLVLVVACSSAVPALAADDLPVFSISANGSRSTRPFTVKDHWEIRWESKEGVSVSVLRADADSQNPLNKLPVAAGSQLTPGAGSTYIEAGGRFYLQIMSMGDWSISVVQLP